VAEGKERLWRQITRWLIPVGVLVAFSGLIVYQIMNKWTWHAKGLGIGGLAVAAVCIILNIDWIARSIAKKRTLIGLNVLIMVALAVGVFGIVSAVNVRHYKRFDMTKVKRFGLDSQTVNLLRSLKEPLTITTLYSPDTPDGAWLYVVRDLLQEYQYHSKKVRVRHLDPFVSRGEVQALLKKLKLDSVSVNSIVLEYGDKCKQVKNSEMIEYPPRNPYNPYSQEPPKFKGEEVITAAIMSIIEDKPTKIYFTTGHGERDTENYEDRGPGYSEIAKLLKRENYTVEKVDLMQKKEVPDDCDVLVIAGPKSPFDKDEIEVIREYLNDEGKLMVMVEPKFISEQPIGLEDLLSEYLVEVDRDVVVLSKVLVLFQGVQIVAQVSASGSECYPSHEITDGMKNERTVFYATCEVKPMSSDPEAEYDARTLVRSDKGSWGETELVPGKKKQAASYDPGNDKAGPISIAVAVSPKPPMQPSPYGGPPMPVPGAEAPKGPRLVVFGTAEFAANSFADTPGNQDLFMNCIGWLAVKEMKLGIRPKDLDIRRIHVGSKAGKAMFVIAVVCMPLCGVLLGLGVWIIRRH